VKMIFYGKNIEVNNVSDSIKEKADKLQVILITRLGNHTKRRIKNPKVRDHYCFGWAAKNMSHMMAIMLLYFDKHNCVWIRNGNVTGCGFAVRHAEHAKKASTKRTSGGFYLRYRQRHPNETIHQVERDSSTTLARM